MRGVALFLVLRIRRDGSRNGSETRACANRSLRWFCN
jgi:hypothetical protein